MVAPVKREKHGTRQREVLAPPLNRQKVEPKRRPKAQPVLGNWGYRLILSGCLFLIWCLTNGLIMMETKTYNWQKSQVSAKEMKVRQLQADIAQRLSELAKNSPQQPFSHPILLSVSGPKPKPTLLGRR